ncbi:MAG: response regulator [Chromatiales bacterium]|nr:response regulator [Chromatiales bacterium]
MSKIRVLVVDDAAFIRDFIRKGLRAFSQAFEVAESSNGAQAQSMLRNHQYDLVLCDWEMPEMNGHELLTWVRSEERLKALPFVMVTSRGDKEFVMQALKAGASNYIVKPFSNDVLIKKVAQVLKMDPTELGAAKPTGNVNGPAFGSVEVLTQFAGGKKREEAAPAAEAAATHAARPAPANGGDAASRPRPVAQLRFDGATVASVIRGMDLKGLRAVVRREDPLPALLEPIAVDIQASGVNETLRLNAFVFGIQAEPNLATRQIELSVCFADDDPGKRANLSRLLEALRR